MGLDFVSIILALLIIIIFMAIFTLLRTMNSPFIKRFEKVIDGQIESLPNLPGSYRLVFDWNGRQYEILEIQYKTEKDGQKAYNKYIFLRVSTKGTFFVQYQDAEGTLVVNNFLSKLLNTWDPAERNNQERLELDGYYKNFLLTSNEKFKAEHYLNVDQVSKIMFEYNQCSMVRDAFQLPIVIEKGYIIFDYRLSALHLNSIVHNSKALLKHLFALSVLANEIDKLES